MPRTVSFDYLNHRGVRSIRTVDVDSVEFIFDPGFGYQPGWFICGYDQNKKARRSFALSRITINDPADSKHVFRLLNI